MPAGVGSGQQGPSAERLAAALAASEARRVQLERTVRDMPRLRRGIAYALTAWCLASCTCCFCVAQLLRVAGGLGD